MKILCSACLLGQKCRRDAKSKPNQKLVSLYEKYGEDMILPVCPEVLGGLSTPRSQCECTGDGLEVLQGKAQVISIDGNDCSKEFIFGAQKTLELAKQNGIEVAILKSKSPSCGKCTFDGKFTDTLCDFRGITYALLQSNDIQIYSDLDIDDLLKKLNLI